MFMEAGAPTVLFCHGFTGKKSRSGDSRVVHKECSGKRNACSGHWDHACVCFGVYSASDMSCAICDQPQEQAFADGGP